MLTDEQFAKLIETIKPAHLAAPEEPPIEKRDRALALEVLQCIERNCYWMTTESAFAAILRETCKGKI